MLSTMAPATWLPRLVGRAWFWVAVVLLIAAMPIARAFTRRLPPMLPVLGEVPAFSLVDQNGENFGSTDLAGRAWIAAALSPSAQEGDLIGGELRRIQHRAHNLGADFHVVSISTEPDRDAPPDLDAFVKRHRGSPRMWSFLTGDKTEVTRVLSSFSSLSGRRGAWFLLVDGALRARAVYDPRDPDVVEHVLFDLALLVNRGG
jgi:protein SCO1/2